MKYILRSDLISINHTQINLYGGRLVIETDNIQNSNSFEYLISMVENDDYYPSAQHKAAAYTFFIIKDHIFVDGNKRTGMTAGLLFLRENGYELEISDQEVEETPLALDGNRLSFDELVSFYSKISSMQTS